VRQLLTQGAQKFERALPLLEIHSNGWEMFQPQEGQGMSEIEEKIQAQRRFQIERGLPDFAPSFGICWRCHRQIYERISLEKASTELITGCPFCCWSYCD